MPDLQALTIDYFFTACDESSYWMYCVVKYQCLSPTMLVYAQAPRFMVPVWPSLRQGIASMASTSIACAKLTEPCHIKFAFG